MISTESGTVTGGRFSPLLSGKEKNTELWDTVIYENDDILCVPTLGSIVPYWLLIIPKLPSFCFAEREAKGCTRLSETLGEVIDNLNLPSDQTLWFEHGAVHSGSVNGCGVDYAHAHIIVQPEFSFSLFSETVFRNFQGNWAVFDSLKGFPTPSSFSDYFIFGYKNFSFISYDTDDAGPQFFRRVIANLVGLDEQWDYRKFTHSRNIELTLEKFGKL